MSKDRFDDLTEADTVDTLCLRIGVTNSGRTAAHVEVYAQRLERWTDGGWESVPDFQQMNLRWSYTDQRDAEAKTYLALLMPGTTKYCDVAHMVKPDRLHSSTGTLVFDVIDGSKVRSNWLRTPGMYCLHVVVAAENSKPIHRVVEITSQGTWPPEHGRFRDHIDMRVLR